MSTRRDIVLSPQDLALKLAVREAIEAAGGQAFVARELDCAQSRLSDWCSPNTGDFIPLDKLLRLEALGAGKPGHPHATRALARASGARIAGRAPVDSALEDLGDHMAELAREHAELLGALAAQDLAGCIGGLSPNARARIGSEARDLIAQLEELCAALDLAPVGGAAGNVRPLRTDTS